MFEEFRPSSAGRDDRRRFGGSMAVAGALYGVVAILVITGTRAAKHVVEEKLMQIQFVPPPPEVTPEPEPPPPIQEAASTPRPKAKRKELKPPDEVPQSKPTESDAPLAAAEPSGPVDGFTDGVEGGTGTRAVAPPPPPPPPPPPKPEPLVAPVPLKSNPAPPYSASARRKEVEGVVVVNFEVLENGSVANVQIISGPEELRESVLKTIPTWRFEPARRGGKAVRCRQTKSIQFRLSSA